jgi:hypothetical protein
VKRKHHDLVAWQQAILETCLVISQELGYGGDIDTLRSLADRVFALINGLMNAERRKGAVA